jgi:hypothetical protein
MEKEIFTDNTYSLAKGLHHINLAKQYFEDVRIGTSKDLKAIFNNYINKCEWIITDVKTRVNDECREILKSDLSDPLVFESITDKLVYINNEQRQFIESLLEAMVNGEEIKMIDDPKNIKQ